MTSRSSKPSRGRSLRSDELQLWKKVTETVVPSDERSIIDESFESMMRQHNLPQVPRPAEAPQGTVSSSDVVRPSLRPHTPAMATFDSRKARQISRGHVTIDAVLDLHGFRQDEAYSALKRFLVQSQASGARYVTVITGKGRSTTASDYGSGVPEVGVLRRVVRAWLEDADFRSLVVSYTTAPRNHGGEGALFVHVRRANRPRRI